MHKIIIKGMIKDLMSRLFYHTKKQNGGERSRKLMSPRRGLATVLMGKA